MSHEAILNIIFYVLTIVLFVSTTLLTKKNKKYAKIMEQVSALSSDVSKSVLTHFRIDEKQQKIVENIMNASNVTVSTLEELSNVNSLDSSDMKKIVCKIHDSLTKGMNVKGTPEDEKIKNEITNFVAEIITTSPDDLKGEKKKNLVVDFILISLSILEKKFGKLPIQRELIDCIVELAVVNLNKKPLLKK